MARGSLSADVIFERALEILDAEGLDALTMARLATSLGVAPSAIYWHVKTRDDVLRGVLDLVYGGIQFPEPDTGTWESEVEAVCHALRDQLLAHPHAMQLRWMASPLSAVRLFSALLRPLLRARLDHVEAVRAVQLFSSYTIGAVASEVTARRMQTGTDLLARVSAAWVEVNGLDALGVLPLAVEIDRDLMFEQGLGYLVDGVRRVVAVDAPPRV